MMKTSNPVRYVTAIVLVGLIVSSFPADAVAFDADADFRYATSLFRKQRWKYAAEAFQEFLKENETHSRAGLARLYLGLSLNSLEDYEPARVQFETFVKANPESRNLADARYRIGECSFYLKEYDKAIPQLTEYLQKHSGHTLNSWASLILAESHNAIEEWSRAEAIVRPLIKGTAAADIMADAVFALGVSLQGQRKFPEAIEMFQQVLDLKSKNLSHRALARIGTIHFSAEKFAEASAAWDRLVEHYGDQSIAASASLRSGIAQFQLKEYEQALTRLNNVPQNSPVFVLASMWKGICRREMGQLDAARTELTAAFTAAGEDPVAAEIMFNRAQIEVLDGKKEVAAQMFMDLATRWPKDERVYDAIFNSAELKMESGDLDAAQRQLDQIRQDFPEQAKLHRFALLAGRMLLNQNRVPEAIQALQNLTVPESASQRDRLLRSYHLIRALHRGKKFQGAVAEFEPMREAFKADGSGEFLGAIALASISCLELKEYARCQMFAQEFLTIEKDPDRTADALAAHAVASSHLKQFGVSGENLNRLTKDFSDNAQSWIAVLQSAEAAWNHQDFEVSARFFGLATDRKDDAKRHMAALSGAAWSYYRLRQYQNSAELFKRLYNEYPASTDAIEAKYMAASCLLEQKMPDEAADMFVAVFNALDKTATAETLKNSYFLDSGRMYARIKGNAADIAAADAMWERIAVRFDMAAELDEILDEWAFLNLQHEQFARSDEIYARLLDRFPESRFAGQARLSLAESHMQANRLDVALREFTAIATHENYGATEKEAALYHAIDIHAARRDWEDVIRLAQVFADKYSASELAPNVQLLYGEGLLDQNKTEEASAKLGSLRRGVIDGSLKPDPWTDRIWVALAEVALVQKDYGQVDSLSDELTARSPQSRFMFQMWDVQGRRWKKQAPPDFDKAREYFGRVINSEIARGTETAARCQFQIAESFLLQGDHKAALKEFYRVYLNYAYNDWRAVSLFQAAGCEVKLNEIDAAVRSYSDLLKDFPDSEHAEKARAKLEELKSGKS